MRRGHPPFLLALGLGLAGCFGPSIADLNANPAKYYQNTVKIVGQITRTQALPGETLLELADARSKRILVKVAGPVEAGPTDWVKVKGLYVPETRIGNQTVYDVVTAEEVSRTRPPWLRNLD